MDHGIPSRLCTWAADMQGPAFLSLLQPSDFTNVCRGPTREIWQYVVNNVFPKQIVSDVNRNLVLYDHDHMLSAKLLDERDKLQMAVQARAARIGILERKLRKCKDELFETEYSYRMLDDSLNEVRLKTRLLNSYRNQCRAQCETYRQQYTTKLISKAMRIKKHSLKTTPDEQLYASTAEKFESKCTHDLRLVHAQVAKFLQSLLEGGDRVRRSIRSEKADIWSHVETILASHSIEDIVLSLMDCTQQATYELREATAAVNVKKDAEALMFKFNESRLVDMATHPSLSQGIHRLLEEHQKAHAQQFFDTERLANETQVLKQELHDTQARANERLLNLLAGDDHKLTMCRDLIARRSESAGAAAALACLTQAAHAVEADVVRGAEQVRILRQKLERIQTFRSIVESKQNQICVLAKQNAASEQRLGAQLADARRYVQDSLCEGEGEAHSAAAGEQLITAARDELRAFASPSLHLRYLLPPCAQAIGELLYARGPAVVQVHEVVRSLCGGLHKSPVETLRIIMRTCAELCYAHTASSDSARYEDAAALASRVEGLCRKASRGTDEQLSRHLPKLRASSEACMKATLRSEEQVRIAIDCWVDEPAQNLVHGVTVLGKTYQQWKKAVVECTSSSRTSTT